MRTNLVLFLVLGLVALGSCVGCLGLNATAQERVDMFQAHVESLKELDVDGRVVVIWGGGHVAGQAFNITGSNGFAEVTLKAGDDQESTE